MRLMLVDDSRAMRMILKRYLSEADFGGCEVMEAENGAAALRMIEAKPPDMIIADWNMPEMSGYDLLKALAERDVNIPFGFVTSEGTPEMRKLAEEAGARFLIAKPFTQDIFLKTIARHCPHGLA